MFNKLSKRLKITYLAIFSDIRGVNFIVMIQYDNGSVIAHMLHLHKKNLYCAYGKCRQVSHIWKVALIRGLSGPGSQYT